MRGWEGLNCSMSKTWCLRTSEDEDITFDEAHTLYTMYLHKPNSTVVSPAGRLRNLLCHIMVTAFFQYQTKTKLSLSLSLSLSLHFNSHFPGEPWLATVYWSKGQRKRWWQLDLQVVQSSSQIITTNKPTPSLLQAGCPSCRPTNSVKVLKGTKQNWLCCIIA